MTPLREWLKPPRTLLLSLVLLTLASVCALSWFGWRFLEQQRIVERQQAQERVEQEADRAVATLRGTLAEAADRLSDWDPSEPPPSGAVFLIEGNRFSIKSRTRLLYQPVADDEVDPNDGAFAAAELFETALNQPREALRLYHRLAASSDDSIRAGALMRIARVQRSLGNLPEARAAYRILSTISRVRTGGLPADLVGEFEAAVLNGDKIRLAGIRDALREGRWRLTRGQFEFYWSEVAEGTSVPEDGDVFSKAVAVAWMAAAGDDEFRGQQTQWISGRPFLIVWRGAPERRVVLVSPAREFLEATLPDGRVRYSVLDAGGRTIVGDRSAALRPAVRAAAETQLPWTLYVSEAGRSFLSATAAQERLLLLGVAVMVLFLIAGTFFIARAIRRESEVARMQSDFVSLVSHEFRSPLTSIRQLSEMLAEGRAPFGERRQVYYETLVKETTRLQRLVEALLNFGRMEAGSREYRFEPLDAGQVVERVVDEFKSNAAARDCHIEAVGGDSECVIQADPDAITVALRNLVDNAIKYSPDCPTIWVEWGRQDDLVAIRVRDRGRGITSGERRAIFRRFVRGTAAEATGAKGSGLGLAMVRHIVSAHQGQIFLASEPGDGTAFTILLPRVVSAEVMKV